MSIGKFLRQKREEKNLTLDQIAEKTHIRIAFLEAIEADRLEDLPSLSQARGFSRLYAATMGINPLLLFEEGRGEALPTYPDSVSQLSKIDVAPTPVLLENSGKSINPTGKKRKVKTGKDSLVPDREIPVSQAIFEEIGKELKKQREALGLSREDVERQIKIREFFLYALEQGKIDDLPSTVQGRGMLNNYAAFMNLDTDLLQYRYAEGLHQKRSELLQDEESTRKAGKSLVGKEPLTGWRRFLTPDLVIGGGVFLVLLILVIWGATQVIRTTMTASAPTIDSISEILLSTPTLTSTSGEVQTPSDLVVTTTPQIQTTPLVDLQATMNAISSASVQVVIVAYQRAFMQIYVDGKEVFTGRVVPGNVYNYSGSTKITLLTGNAGALQVYFNQQDKGILGPLGEVASLEFDSREMVTPTPRFTPTLTRTVIPTLTPLPTNTPQPTPTVPTVTITPLVPGQ